MAVIGRAREKKYQQTIIENTIENKLWIVSDRVIKLHPGCLWYSTVAIPGRQIHVIIRSSSATFVW